MKSNLESGNEFSWWSHSLRNISLARYEKNVLSNNVNRLYDVHFFSCFWNQQCTKTIFFYIEKKERKRIIIGRTSFPPCWREATSWEVNLAIDTDFTRCVNSRLGKTCVFMNHYIISIIYHECSLNWRKIVISQNLL